VTFFLSIVVPPNFCGFVKSQIIIEPVIPANPGSGPGQAPESSYLKMFWTPVSTGVTTGETFYEIFNFYMENRLSIPQPP
jgi:hypothetical protein